MNADLRTILLTASNALAAGATDAETCKHSDNPAWQKVVDAIDECTDILRDIAAELDQTQPQEGITLGTDPLSDQQQTAPDGATHRYHDYQGNQSFLKDWKDANKDGSYIIATVWSNVTRRWRKRGERIDPKNATAI